MSNDVFEKVKLLPPEKQQQVEEFVDYLLTRYGMEKPNEELSLADMRLKNMGWAKGQIWMADDFNNTPEEFKDYI